MWHKVIFCSANLFQDRVQQLFQQLFLWLTSNLIMCSAIYFSLKFEFLEALLSWFRLSETWALLIPLLRWVSSRSAIFELQWEQWTQISACAGPSFLAIIERNLRAGPSLSPSLKVKWSSVKSGSAEPSILWSRNTWKNNKKTKMKEN